MFLATTSRWNVRRGFGFLLADAAVPGCSDREIFCHAKKLPKGTTQLVAGQRVEFVPIPAKLSGKQPEARVTRSLDAEQAEAA